MKREDQKWLFIINLVLSRNGKHFFFLTLFECMKKHVWQPNLGVWLIVAVVNWVSLLMGSWSVDQWSAPVGPTKDEKDGWILYDLTNVLNSKAIVIRNWMVGNVFCSMSGEASMWNSSHALKSMGPGLDQVFLTKNITESMQEVPHITQNNVFTKNLSPSHYNLRLIFQA